MLTIREPIKLNIADDLLTLSDAFYERVAGNYGMMSASITPKDLLFYLSAPPEIPDDLGSMTTVAVRNSMTDRRSVSMEIINNVVNRILLSTGNDFTYQDQVYIDNVLGKLGITDVSLFMKQVQNLSEEQNSIRELISLYNEELSLRGSAQGGRTESVKPALSRESSGSEATPSSPRLYLQNEIYKRLETGAIYNIVNAFQGGQPHVYGSFHNNEMKTAEQLFVSRMLMLSDMKERAVPGGPVILRHMENSFEIGDILPAPASEEAVLSQAAAASLLATVEHALVEKLFSRSSANNLWLSLEQSLSETVENSISRFQSRHTDYAVDARTDNTAVENTVSQYRSEARVLHELIDLRRRLGDITVNMNTEQSTYAEAPSMEFIENTGNRDDNSVRYGDSYSVKAPGVTEKSGADIIRENTIRDKSRELKNLIRPENAAAGDAPGHTPAAMEHPAPEPGGVSAADTEKRLIEKQKSMMSTKEIAERTRDILSRELPYKIPTPSASASAIEVPPAKTVRQIELEYGIAERAEALEKLVYSYSAQQASAQSGEQEKRGEPPAQIPPINELVGQTFLLENSKTVRNSYAGVTGGIVYQKSSESGSAEKAKAPSAPRGEAAGAAPDAAGFAVGGSEVSPELIAKEVSEIDRHNREIFESVKLSQIAKPAEHIPAADREKTMSMSLRALESPEAVMKEIMAAVPPASGPSGTLSPQAEAFLQSADEQTRRIFEAVMRYEQNPQAAPPEKLFHVGSIGELNAASASRSGAQPALTPGDSEKLLREKELLSQTRENVLEQFSELPAGRMAAGNVRSEPPRVPIVHKIEQTDFSEELLEKLEQQKTRQSTVQSQSVTEEVTDRQVREITQNDLNTQLVSQSAEDITKLVNQTIAKQMNTISDKVYRQMEKRLQTERSRRGRF